jgi:hypothetical protein
MNPGHGKTDARKYVLTFGREYVSANVQSSGSGFRAQMSLGDEMTSHISKKKSNRSSEICPGSKSAHDLDMNH